MVNWCMPFKWLLHVMTRIGAWPFVQRPTPCSMAMTQWRCNIEARWLCECPEEACLDGYHVPCRTIVMCRIPSKWCSGAMCGVFMNFILCFLTDYTNLKATPVCALRTFDELMNKKRSPRQRPQVLEQQRRVCIPSNTACASFTPGWG